MAEELSPVGRLHRLQAGLARRPVTVSVAAIAVRALSLLAIVALAGPHALSGRFAHLRVTWVIVVAAAQLSTYPAYALAYRSLVRRGRQSELTLSTIVRIVVAGFGPLAATGGFAVDRAVLDAGEDGSAVGAMATIEWAVLAPVTCAVTIALLVTGADLSGTLLWPWAVGVPIGVACALYFSRPGPAERLSHPFGRRSAALGRLVDAIRWVIAMARRPVRYAGAWIGTALYWTFEICALYAALHAVRLDPDAELTVLAYATGYLASRRSLPLGGAGVTEALLVYSLWQIHQPLGPAIDAVIIYRFFNFLVVIIPSLIAYRGLTPTAPTGVIRAARSR